MSYRKFMFAMIAFIWNDFKNIAWVLKNRACFIDSMGYRKFMFPIIPFIWNDFKKYSIFIRFVNRDKCADARLLSTLMDCRTAMSVFHRMWCPFFVIMSVQLTGTSLGRNKLVFWWCLANGRIHHILQMTDQEDFERNYQLERSKTHYFLSVRTRQLTLIFTFLWLQD